MKRLVLVPILAILLCGFACNDTNKLEQNARDTTAALGGLLTTAQAQFMASCTADKTQPNCVLINRGVQGQNALITALETYCSMPVSPFLDPNTPCTPVASAQAGLQTALNNATQLVTEIKGVVKP
jgi:hypothetical protein